MDNVQDRCDTVINNLINSTLTVQNVNDKKMEDQDDKNNDGEKEIEQKIHYYKNWNHCKRS